jgi:hypothetical protein
MTSKLRAKKFRIPRPDVLEAVDASLGVTDGNPSLAVPWHTRLKYPRPTHPRPE